MKKLLSKIGLYSLAMAMAQPHYDTGRDTPQPGSQAAGESKEMVFAVLEFRGPHHLCPE